MLNIVRVREHGLFVSGFVLVCLWFCVVSAGANTIELSGGSGGDNDTFTFTASSSGLANDISVSWYSSSGTDYFSVTDDSGEVTTEPAGSDSASQCTKEHITGTVICKARSIKYMSFDLGAGNDKINLNDGTPASVLDHVTIETGEGSDTVIGSSIEDRIYGGSGDDKIFGVSGENWIYGESGNDILYGGSDDDLLEGGSGDDGFEDEQGSNEFKGGSDNDTIYYWGADSSVVVILDGSTNDGATSSDNVSSDIENIYGSEYSDRITAVSGANKIYGSGGNDTIDAASGADTIFGGSGSDTIYAGLGDDTIYDDSGSDIVNGGEDSDTINYSNQDDDVTVNLQAGTGVIGGETDTLLKVENAVGTDYGDTLSGSGEINSLDGGAGDDLIRVSETFAPGNGLELDSATCGTGIDTVLTNFGVDAADSTCETIKSPDQPEQTTSGSGEETVSEAAIETTASSTGDTDTRSSTAATVLSSSSYKFTASASKRQKPLKSSRKGILVKVSCTGSSCKATAKGSITVKSGSKKTKIALATGTKTLTKANKAGEVWLKLSKASQKKLKKALRPRKAKATATIKVTVVDSTGQKATTSSSGSSSQQLTVSVKR